MSVIPRAACALAIVFLFVFPADGQGAKPAIPDEPRVQGSEGSYDFSVEGRVLDTIDELGITGSTIEVDPVTWRLAVKGPDAARPVSLTYGELSAIPRVNRVSLLICPGFFEDVAEWGGVPIADLLALAGVAPMWKELVVRSVDGYTTLFSREEVDTHVLFVALTVNGQTLPKAHGFPARLVAEGILGGRWAKWISSIEVR